MIQRKQQKKINKMIKRKTKITDLMFVDRLFELIEISDHINFRLNDILSSITCHFCRSTMATHFFDIKNRFGVYYICEKCVYNVKSYKSRICDNCTFPIVHKLNTKKDDIYYENIGYSFNKCEVCKKYTKRIQQQYHTDFFKIDVLQKIDSDDMDVYSDIDIDIDDIDDIDSDSDSDSDSD